MSVKLMSPTGHLGFTPIESGSFRLGLEQRPDAIVADSGSADIGPYPLGADHGHSPEKWQRSDLELCLLGARELGVPLVIGSAADTGTDRGVDGFVRMIREIAAEHDLAPFDLAAIHSEVTPASLADYLDEGRAIQGLGGRPDADAATIERTDRAVAVMGVEPIKAALEAGADVVICGRSSDSAIFAAVAEHLGAIPRGPALLAGKLLECASFCAEPFMGKETVIGEVDADGVTVEPMHPGQRCTPASVASHAMYERIDPYEERVPGGLLDMRELRFEAIDERRTRVTGAVWRPEDTYAVKLEGSGKVGERALAIMGIRDPYTLERLDDVLEWSRTKLAERYGKPEDVGYTVHFHVYGRDGVLREYEPNPVVEGHEVGIVVEATATTPEAAQEVCALASRNLFYARLPEVKGTAGGASFFSDEVLDARPGYEWTLNHTVALDPPGTHPERALGLFRTQLITVDGKGR
jgi:hypothetical protein